MAIAWLDSRNPPNLGRAWKETLRLLGLRWRAHRGWKTEPGAWEGCGVGSEMDRGSREQEHLQLLCFILLLLLFFFPVFLFFFF